MVLDRDPVAELIKVEVDRVAIQAVLQRQCRPPFEHVRRTLHPKSDCPRHAFVEGLLLGQLSNTTVGSHAS